MAAAVLGAVLLSGCAGETDEEPGPDQGPVRVSERAVILTPDDVSDKWLDDVDWTPEADDVRAVDAVLAKHQAQEPDLGIEPYDEYYRQYIGLDGDAVYVNAMCRPMDDWQETYTWVTDGGSCYWQAKVRDGRVESWVVNGDA